MFSDTAVSCDLHVLVTTSRAYYVAYICNVTTDDGFNYFDTHLEDILIIIDESEMASIWVAMIK